VRLSLDVKVDEGLFEFVTAKECEMGEEGGLGNRQRRNGVEREVRLEREKVSLDHLRIELCELLPLHQSVSQKEMVRKGRTHFAC